MAALSINDWALLGSGVLTLGDEIIKLVRSIHPLLAYFLNEFEFAIAGGESHQTAVSRIVPTVVTQLKASPVVQNWVANPIPGYNEAGVTVPIENPDNSQ
jgi:hypothetical protein